MNFTLITKPEIISLKKKTLAELFCGIDDEMHKKKVVFSRREAIQDDLYDLEF